jgi:hypothetical protein
MVAEALARVERTCATDEHIERYGVHPGHVEVPQLVAPRRFGAAVLAARNGLELDIHDVARETGISASKLRSAEMGGCVMSAWELGHLCDYLGLEQPRRVA